MAEISHNNSLNKGSIFFFSPNNKSRSRLALECCLYHNVSMLFLSSCFAWEFCLCDHKMDGESPDTMAVFLRGRRKNVEGKGQRDRLVRFRSFDSISWMHWLVTLPDIRCFLMWYNMKYPYRINIIFYKVFLPRSWTQI